MDRKFVAAENVVFVVVSCVVCMVPADRAVTSGPLRTVDTVIEGHGLAVYEIEIVLPLQLSWLRPLSTRLTVRPLQDPTFVPVGTTFAPLVPPMAKSAWVQAGLAPFVCELKASTVAVIDEIVTEPGLGFVKSPLRAPDGPPGLRVETVDVCLTVMAAVESAVADPLPEPLWVQ